MDAERIVTRGRLINQHGKLGRKRYDRFTPGFTAAIMTKLGSHPGTFNQMATRLWREPVAKALTTLGTIYADRPSFPHAVLGYLSPRPPAL